MLQAKGYNMKYDIHGGTSGVHSVDAFAEGRIMVKMSTVDLLQRATIQCPDCGKAMGLIIKGNFLTYTYLQSVWEEGVNIIR